MNKYAYIGLAVILAFAVAAFYKVKESERREAYEVMAKQVAGAMNDMTSNNQTKEKLEKHVKDLSNAMTPFSNKVKKSDADLLKKLQEAQEHLKAAINDYPPPMTEQDINDQMIEMYKQTNVSLESANSTDRTYKVDGLTLDGGKRQEAITKVNQELDQTTELLNEVYKRLSRP